MSYLNQSKAQLLASTMPAERAMAVTDDVPFDECRALWVGTAGTGTVTFADGTVAADFPLLAGVNPLRCITVGFGTCDDVWALY